MSTLIRFNVKIYSWTVIGRINVRINLKKSSWAVDLSKHTIDILGFNIGLGKISPTLSKSNKISSFPTPMCTKDVQQCLGMANFLHTLLLFKTGNQAQNFDFRLQLLNVTTRFLRL